MAKHQDEDQDIEEAKRIMERLVKTPPKPHAQREVSTAEGESRDDAPSRKQGGRRSPKGGS